MEIQQGVRLLKLKKRKRTSAVIENLNENNKSITVPIPEVRAEYLKLLAEICEAVPFLDLRQKSLYKCRDMSPEDHIDVLSQAIFHALFSKNKNLERLNVEDKVNQSGRHTKYVC